MLNLINFKIYNSKLFGFNPVFNTDIMLATIDHEQKEVRPVKEYLFPHPFGNKSKRYARMLGYSFNNN